MHLQVPKAAWDATEPVEDDATPWWSVEIIKSVSFRGNQITEIPPELCTLADVQSMNFCSNELQQIPPEIANLKDLRILLLSENKYGPRTIRLGNLSCSFLSVPLPLNNPAWVLNDCLIVSTG